MKSLYLLVLIVFSVTSAHAKFRIGLILPLSGPAATTGQDIANGTRAAFEDINAKGGIRGKQVELIIEDNKFDNKLTEELTNQLIKARKVDALLSCFGTVNCVTIAKLAQAAGVPLVGPVAGAESLRAPELNKVYSIRASATEEVQALLGYLNGAGKINTALIVQDDGFGKSYAKSLADISEKNNFKPSASVSFDPAKPNYADIAVKAKQSNPEKIVLLAGTQHSIGIIKALNEVKYFGQILNLAGQANTAVVKGLNGGTQMAVFAAVTPSPFANNTLVAQQYRANWETVTKNKLYSYAGFEAYINARLLVEALQKAKSDNPAGIDRSLSELSNLNLGGFKLSFANNARQAGNYTDTVVLLSDGRFKH